MNRLLLVLAAAVLAGCGGGESGSATLWVTRDRGAHVLLARKVPAGLTAMQALDRVADVKTRYGGRFVQGIDGLQGSFSGRRDWFYFVNGYEADRSAAEYRLRRGDVEWWDFRSWRTRMEQPVVVGAFPEPFLHGYDGKRRPAVVQYDRRNKARASAVADRLHAKLLPLGAAVPREANLLVLRCSPGEPNVEVRMRSGRRAGGPIVFVVNCHDDFEARVRFKFEVRG